MMIVHEGPLLIVTSGNEPSEGILSLLSKKYRSRQSLLPLVSMRRYGPLRVGMACRALCRLNNGLREHG
jgi:hypothetical protein